MTVRQANRRSLRHAFTLLEILVVVAIIVVLAGVGAYYLIPRGEEAKMKLAKANAEGLATQCEMFENDVGRRPTTLQELLNPPDGHAPYVQPKALLDPWGQEYRYNSQGPNNNNLRPDIWSEHNGKTFGNF
jgi:general secretion pathway protein G